MSGVYVHSTSTPPGTGEHALADMGAGQKPGSSFGTSCFMATGKWKAQAKPDGLYPTIRLHLQQPSPAVNPEPVDHFPAPGPGNDAHSTSNNVR